MKHPFQLDLSGIEALLLPEPSEGHPSRETTVPVERRGVIVSWMFEFIRAVENALADLWKRYENHEKAYEHLNWAGLIPEAERPTICSNQPLTGYFLAEHIIEPLTAKGKTALYSRVPPEALGEPSVFISHAWADALGRHVGTTLIDMTSGNQSVGDKTACWIDLFVYNQHQPQDIADDMERIIGEIGKLVVPMPSVAVAKRLWCMWEWLCAHRSGANIVLPEVATDRYYFGRKRQWFDEEFTSIADAVTTLDADRDQILTEIIRTFGSIDEADKTLRATVDRQFTRKQDAPWRKKSSDQG